MGNDRLSPRTGRLSSYPNPSVGERKPPFEHVVEGYERALFLREFIEAGRIPQIRDVEVAACFADLRGFTKYVDALQSKWQDRRVQDFLGAYFQVYPKAVLDKVYALEPEEGSEISAQQQEIRNAIVPSMFKNLGDGMMLVWELEGGRSVQDGVAACILQTIATIQRFFTRLITQEAKGAPIPYSTIIDSLRLGFGLARGHAWRIDFGIQRPPDYAGSIINLAARLQDLARPEGVVAEAGFCDPVFAKDRSRISEVSVKGIEKSVRVWMSPTVKVNV